jgi:hypothetical protein
LNTLNNNDENNEMCSIVIYAVLVNAIDMNECVRQGRALRVHSFILTIEISSLSSISLSEQVHSRFCGHFNRRPGYDGLAG